MTTLLAVALIIVGVIVLLGAALLMFLEQLRRDEIGYVAHKPGHMRRMQWRVAAWLGGFIALAVAFFVAGA